LSKIRKLLPLAEDAAFREQFRAAKREAKAAPETRAALDLIFSDHFSRSEHGIFEAIRHALRDGGDHYRHLADLADYARAHAELDACYADRETWSRRAINNVSCSGKFSSDRAIREYAGDIWNLKPSPVT
jgi:starch phosphorylase